MPSTFCIVRYLISQLLDVAIFVVLQPNSKLMGSFQLRFHIKQMGWYFVSYNCSLTLKFCSTYIHFTREKRQRDRPLSKHKKKRSLVHTTCSFTKRCTMRKLEAHFAIQIRKIHNWKRKLDKEIWLQKFTVSIFRTNL